MFVVSISLSSGFSFQVVNCTIKWWPNWVSISLSSGFSFQDASTFLATAAHTFVSISLSSGFSFQAKLTQTLPAANSCFNLVIERLLISGSSGVPTGIAHERFNLVIERLLISGAPQLRQLRIIRVSISLSSGFSFQVHSCLCPALSPTLFQSRYRAASHFRKWVSC